MRILVAILFGLFLSSSCFGVERWSANTTIGAVSNAMVQCAPGDTLVITNGFASWTNGLYVTNAITVRGAGVGVTVISNACLPANADAFKPVFHFALGSHSAVASLGNLTVCRDPSQTTLLTGNYGTLVTGDNSDGRRMVITNVHYTNLTTYSIRVEGALGVASRCQFDVSTVAIYGFHWNWNGGDYGHGAWATNDMFGTDQFWFIENCGFNRTEAGSSYTTIDGLGGWRYVARFNNFTNTTLEGHGPETGNSRGTRAVEDYGNHFWWTGGALASISSFVRSGVQLHYSNTLHGILGTAPFNLSYSRRYENQATWGGVTGTNIYDQMVVAPVYTNIVASTNGLDTRSWGVTIAGNPFTANQHQGRTLYRPTDVGGHGLNTHSVVLSNTTSTLYFAVGQNAQLRFAAGDAIRIYTVPGALDQHGFGMGSLMSGTTPWTTNNQVISACYEWNNVDGSGVDMDFGVPDTNPSVIENTHYFNDTPKPGYVAYTWPHPLTVETPDLPAAFGVQRIGGLNLKP